MKNQVLTWSITSLFVIILLWLAYVTFSYPYIGISLNEIDKDVWVIQRLDAEGMRLGLHIGDKIKSVNGQATGKYWSVIKWNEMQQASKIIVSRNGMDFVVDTSSIRNSPNSNLLSFLSAVLCFLFAFIIYKKARTSSSAKLLSLIFLSMGIVYMGVAASARGDTIGKIIVITILPTLPIIFLHFLLVFFNEKGSIHYSLRLLKFIYLLPALMFLSCLSFFFLEIANLFYNFINPATILIFILGFLFSLFMLIFTYVKHRKQNDYLRMMIKTVWISLAISFLPFIVLSFLPQLFNQPFWIDPIYTGWFILLFPLSFAYLILTKQLYDIEVILRRLLFTVVISTVPGIIIVGGTWFVFTNEHSFQYLVLVLVFAVIVLSSLYYSLEYITRKLEPVIFPRKHHLRKALDKISSDLKGIQSFQALNDIVLTDIMNTLEVYGAAIVFVYPDNSEAETIVAGSIDTNRLSGHLNNADISGDFTLFKVSQHEEYTSFLALTHKRNNTHINKEEADWLYLIVSYLAVSLENLYLIRKLNQNLNELIAQVPDSETAADDLMWLRRVMFEIQEKERYRISFDLHDSTIQDIFLLKREINSYVTSYPHSVEQRKKLERFTSHLDIINVSLRQSCYGLNPYLLEELGLISAVKKLINMEYIDFDISFETKFAATIERVDVYTKKHIFRIIQEMLYNAIKHAEASNVTITLDKNKQGILLNYEDDGVGFDMQELEQSKQQLRTLSNSGLGLEQMKGRILLIGGRWSIDSQPQNGVKMEIQIPWNLPLSVI